MNAHGITRTRAGWLLGILFVLMMGQWIPYLWEASFEPPDAPLPEVALKAFARAEPYARSDEWASVFHWLTTFPLLVLVLQSGWAISVEKRWSDTPWRWPARLGFLAAYWLLATIIDLPYIVSCYWQERRYGLTPLLPGEWLRILGLSSLVPFALFFARQILIYCQMPLFKAWWWLASVLTLFGVFSLLPEVISRTQPIDLVATYTPMEAGPLRSELEDIGRRTGHDLDIYIVDSSKRTHRVNMFLTGRMGREYVMLTDTILEAMSPRELQYILAHELGHNVTRVRVMVINKAIGLILLAATFWIVHRWNGAGPIPAERRLHVLIQLLLVGKLLGLFGAPVYSAVSRWDERACDRYGLEITQLAAAYRGAVLSAARLNMTPYDVPRWAYFLGSTHPTVEERLSFSRRWPAEGEGIGW